MEEIRDRLMGRAFLYADQEAYRAGVQAALDAMARAVHPAAGSGVVVGGGAGPSADAVVTGVGRWPQWGVGV